MADEQNLLKTETNLLPEVAEGVEAVPTVDEAPEREQPETRTEIEEAVEEREPAVSQVPIEVSETPAPAITPSQMSVREKDQLMTDIEEMLSKDLTDVFLALPQEKRSAFKQAGEEAAFKIHAMMETGKVKVKRILELIRNWLRLVPGVNKYFLEQEAKIKTDELVDYYRGYSSAEEHTL